MNQPYLFQVKLKHQYGQEPEETHIAVSKNNVSSVVHLVEKVYGTEVEVIEANPLGWILVEECNDES